MNVFCVICKENCGDSSIKTPIAGEKGRQTLITSSQERIYALHETIESEIPLRIHAHCLKQQTRKSSITFTKREPECHEEQEDDEAPQLRSIPGKIPDVKSDCLFCTEPVTQNIKLA